MNKKVWASIILTGLLSAGTLASIYLRRSHQKATETISMLQQKEVIIDPSMVPNSISFKSDSDKSEPILIRVRPSGLISLDGVEFPFPGLKQKLTKEDRTRVIKVIMEVDDFQMLARILDELKKSGFAQVTFESKIGS